MQSCIVAAEVRWPGSGAVHNPKGLERKIWFVKANRYQDSGKGGCLFFTGTGIVLHWYVRNASHVIAISCLKVHVLLSKYVLL